MTIAWKDGDEKELKEMRKTTGIIGVPSIMNAPDLDMFLDALLVINIDLPSLVHQTHQTNTFP